MYWHESQGQSKWNCSNTPKQPSPRLVFLISCVFTLKVSLCSTRQIKTEETNLSPYKANVSSWVTNNQGKWHMWPSKAEAWPQYAAHRWEAKISSLFNCPELHAVSVLCSISLFVFLFALHFVTPTNLSLGEQPGTPLLSPTAPACPRSPSKWISTCSYTWATLQCLHWFHPKTAPENHTWPHRTLGLQKLPGPPHFPLSFFPALALPRHL